MAFPGHRSLRWGLSISTVLALAACGGSSIRVTFDTPCNIRYWIFGNNKTPLTNTIWHDSTAPSIIVPGYLPYADAKSL